MDRSRKGGDVTPATSLKTGEAEAEVVLRLLQHVLKHPGPRGALTALQIMELQEALATYLVARFPNKFTLDKCEEIARRAVVEHQAQHHAELTAPDVRAQGDSSGRWLLEIATDHALDDLRFLSDSPDSRPASDTVVRTDDQIVSSLFDDEAHAVNVVETLCELHRKGDKIAFRVIICYLELAEARGGEHPSDQEVVSEVGIFGLRPAEVRRIILRFALSLGRSR
jgi:hypothetical protein